MMSSFLQFTVLAAVASLSLARTNHTAAALLQTTTNSTLPTGFCEEFEGDLIHMINFGRNAMIFWMDSCTLRFVDSTDAFDALFDSDAVYEQNPWGTPLGVDFSELPFGSNIFTDSYLAMIVDPTEPDSLEAATWYLVEATSPSVKRLITSMDVHDKYNFGFSVKETTDALMATIADGEPLV